VVVNAFTKHKIASLLLCIRHKHNARRDIQPLTHDPSHVLGVCLLHVNVRLIANKSFSITKKAADPLPISSPI
jgi:hypothetical protein